MTAGEARALAVAWATERLREAPGEIVAAFLYGSVNGLADGDPLPASSDVDVALVVAALDPARHVTRKHLYRGLAIDGWYLPREKLRDPEAVLGDFALGPHLFDDRPVFDPEGILARLHPAVQEGFARRRWIRRRCAALLDDARQFREWGGTCEELPKSVAFLLHVVRGAAMAAPIADLQRPTTKKAFLRSREVLGAYGLAERHLAQLRLLGAERLDGAAVLTSAANAARALREAIPLMRTPFPPGVLFVNESSLPGLLEDVPAWVARGLAPEAFTWVASLYSYALMAMQHDAPEAFARWLPVYLADLAPTEIATLADVRERLQRCAPELDATGAACEAILGACSRAKD